MPDTNPLGQQPPFDPTSTTVFGTITPVNPPPAKSTEQEVRDQTMALVLSQLNELKLAVAQVTTSLQKINLRLTEGDERMGRIETSLTTHTGEEKQWAKELRDDTKKNFAAIEEVQKGLQTNTEVTQIVADSTAALRVLKQLAVWVGAVAGGIAGVVYLITAFGKGPGIGPGP